MTEDYRQKNLLPKDVKMLCNHIIEWQKKILLREEILIPRNTEVSQKGLRIGKVAPNCCMVLELEEFLNFLEIHTGKLMVQICKCVFLQNSPFFSLFKFSMLHW